MQCSLSQSVKSGCHSRESGNPGVIGAFLDSCFRRSDMPVFIQESIAHAALLNSQAFPPHSVLTESTASASPATSFASPRRRLETPRPSGPTRAADQAASRYSPSDIPCWTYAPPLRCRWAPCGSLCSRGNSVYGCCSRTDEPHSALSQNQESTSARPPACPGSHIPILRCPRIAYP